jgi:hypothetical protein
MKKLFLIPLALGLSFCNCKKNSVSKPTMVSIESTCPENGKCSLEIIKNKSLEIKTDEFGKFYYALNDDVAKSVIHYQYNRTIEEGLQDGQHREEIVFEINNSDEKISYSDFALQNTKMLFGRHCFCRGQAGYFKVNQGTLTMERKKGSSSIDLDFKIAEVPQLFTKVKATIK